MIVSYNGEATTYKDCSFRYVCAIEEEESVVITGEYSSGRRVVRYNFDGEYETLPSLITGRGDHACGSFTNSNGATVSCEMKH